MGLKVRFNNVQLVPMSMEQLKLEGARNTRRGDLRQLWFVDGLGNSYLLVTSEIELLGLDVSWPWYMRANWGIKRINQYRQLLGQVSHANVH